MAFKGTPGPWEVDDAAEDYWPLVVKDEQEICTLCNGSMSVGDQYIPGSMDWPVDANARLIAAAPELLSEGQRVHRAVDAFYRCVMEFGADSPRACGEYLDELAQADEALGSAIAKALGEEVTA